MRLLKAVTKSVLLDTQILVLSYLGESLPAQVKDVLQDPQTERLLSAMSLVEVAIKTASGKIELNAVDLQRAIRDLAITVIPFTPEHAYRMYVLPPNHRDPFDRMIIATALVEQVPLIGSDHQFKEYSGLTVIW